MAESRGESQRENSHSKLWGQLSQEEGSQEGLHGLDPQHLRVSLSSSGLDGQILCPQGLSSGQTRSWWEGSHRVYFF